MSTINSRVWWNVFKGIMSVWLRTKKKINSRAAAGHFEELWLFVERTVEPATAQPIWKNDLFRRALEGVGLDVMKEGGPWNTALYVQFFLLNTVCGALAAHTVHHLGFSWFKIILPSWDCDSGENLWLINSLWLYICEKRDFLFYFYTLCPWLPLFYIFMVLLEIC